MLNNPRILLINNIPTHHQFPLASSFHKRLGNSFRFACLAPVPPDRTAIGWQDVGQDLEWVLRTWESKNSMSQFEEWFYEADAVIGLPKNQEWVRKRLRDGKLLFIPSERIWKPSYLSMHSHNDDKPQIISMTTMIRMSLYIIRQLWRWHTLNKSNCHFLSIGSDAARDQAIIRTFKGRMWTYGYFINIPESPPSEKPKDTVKMLWAGRMLPLKKVDILLNALSLMDLPKRCFHLTLIGSGPEIIRLKKMVEDLKLTNNVLFHPVTSPDGVRKAMNQSHIYILPSTTDEGWGAVVNEAMGEGCTVVASRGAGAAQMLIRHGETGFLFPTNDVKRLSEILTFLIKNPHVCRKTGLKAWNYVKTVWSPEEAAERFLALMNSLLNNTPIPTFTDGPLSPARIISHRGQHDSSLVV